LDLYFHTNVYDKYDDVSLTEQTTTTVLMAIGIFPALFATGFVLLSFTKGDKNPAVVGSMLYGCWRWYKLFAGEIPGVIFSFLDGHFLTYAWLLELVVDLIHLYLNIAAFS
jgi:hypothetical protein